MKQHASSRNWPGASPWGLATATIAAIAISLWPAIFLRYMITGYSPESDGYAPHMVSQIITFGLKRDEMMNDDTFPIETLVISVHVYALAIATLHECRRGDKYQNEVMMFSWWVLCFAIKGWIPGVIWRHEVEEGESVVAFDEILMAFTLCMTASAVFHMGMNFRNKRTSGGSDQDESRIKEKAMVTSDDVLEVRV